MNYTAGSSVTHSLSNKFSLGVTGDTHRRQRVKTTRGKNKKIKIKTNH